ncbi:MAG: hypothetical protein AYK23_00530 [Candidatus Proteinoplasmatales archaeon SG8-5]|nr:MAG: hypothetical protein AYK23_00530 [Candidatus Proteinoplasmatales archaeon SG8-5]
MLDNKKLLILLVTVALVGVLSLFLYSSTIKPTEMAISGIDEGMVGKMVKTSGTVTYARTLGDGSLSLMLTEMLADSGIRVYIPSRVSEDLTGVIITPGVEIEVVGEVELYADEVEISVTSAEGVTVLSGSVSPDYELWQVLESVEVLEHMNLTTEGIAYDVDVIESSGNLIGTSFVITSRHQNASYSLDCMYFDADLSPAIEDGDLVKVTGVLEFYMNKGCWQLILNDIEVED